MDAEPHQPTQGLGSSAQQAVANLNRTAAIAALLLVVFAATISWYSWLDAKADSAQTLATVAELESRAINSYFEHLEIGLRRLGAELTPKAGRIDLDRAYGLVKSFKDLQPELFNVTLIAPDGEVLLTAKNPPGTTRASLAKEASFIKFLEEFKQGKVLGIGQPLVGVVSRVVIVPVRYAVKDSRGALSYVVSANLLHEHLRSFWMDAPLAATAAIGLIRDNGFLLSRYPVPADQSLEQIYGRPRTGALINHLQQQGFPERGYVQGPSSLDGPDFLNVFRRLPSYPVTLFVAMPMSEVRKAWWKRMSGTYLATLFLILGGLVTHRYAVLRQRGWDLEQKRLEEAERASESRFLNLADSAPALIWISGADKRFNWFNKVWLNFTGRTMDQETGEGWTQGIHPEDRERCLAAYTTAFDARHSFVMEYRLRRHDGEYRWLIDHGVPRLDEQGSFTGYVGSCIDITQSRKAGEELRQAELLLRSSIDAIGEAFVIYDADDKLVFCNDEYRELYAVSAPVIQPGRSFEEIIRFGVEHGQYRDAIGREEAWIAERMAAHRKSDQNLLQRLSDGRWLKITEKRASSGHLVGFRVDVTELYKAKEAAEAANVAKSSFLATMSHEIRTPMNGILGMAQVLLMPGLAEAERINYARTILSSGASLLALLNDILDISKVEAGKLELESAALEPTSIIRATRLLFAETAERKGLQLAADWTGPADQRYLGDPHRLQQMISNLVSNAIKFTVQGEIRITGRELARDAQGALLEFAVSDTGVGIPADKQPLLFQTFSQTDSSTTRQHGGTGLGLSIVSRLAQLMGGGVGVDSEPGRGSRFWFRIRAGFAAAASLAGECDADPASRAAQAPGELSGRILVVEDNPTNRLVIQAMLSKRQLQCEFAEDGQQAVDALRDGMAPDLVLMDCQMPVMDGFEATRQIRRREAEASLPRLAIIALTAGAFEEDKQRCFDAGMDDFLPKPLEMDKLTAMLGRWLPGGKGGATAASPPKYATPTMQGAPVFDAKGMLSALADDRDLARSVIQAATEDIPGYFDGLEQAMAAGDWKAAGRHIHTLKGLTAQIGGASLSARIKVLDDHLKAGGKIDGAAVVELRGHYGKLSAELNAWLG